MNWKDKQVLLEMQNESVESAIHTVEEAGGACLGIGPNHHMPDRETPFSGLDQCLQGIGEIRDDVKAEGGLPVVSPKSAGRVRNISIG